MAPQEQSPAWSFFTETSSLHLGGSNGGEWLKVVVDGSEENTMDTLQVVMLQKGAIGRSTKGITGGVTLHHP